MSNPLPPTSRPTATPASRSRPTPDEGPSSVEAPQLLEYGIAFPSARLDDLEGAVRRLHSPRVAAVFDATPELLELGVLTTCHRAEVYLWSRGDGATGPALAGLWGDGLPPAPRVGADAVHHLYRIAAGLESMAVGERDVREQVRRASGRIFSRHRTPVLRRLFQGAARAADDAAPHVPASRSIAALAASRALEESPRPFPRVLVLGGGTVGRAVAELLASAGRVTLLYRSHPPEEAFLRRLGARAAPWTALADELALSDVAITAAKSGERLVSVTHLGDRASPLLLIDLGVPRNVDPEIGHRPGVRLIDLEGLHPHARRTPLVDLEEDVARRAGSAAAEVASSALEVWVDGFRRAAEERRRSVLGEARAHLGALTDAQELAVDVLTRRLVNQLLSGPTRGLRALPPGPEGDERRRWALRWLASNAADQ